MLVSVINNIASWAGATKYVKDYYLLQLKLIIDKHQYM